MTREDLDKMADDLWGTMAFGRTELREFARAVAVAVRIETMRESASEFRSCATAWPPGSERADALDTAADTLADRADAIERGEEK